MILRRSFLFIALCGFCCICLAGKPPKSSTPAKPHWNDYVPLGAMAAPKAGERILIFAPHEDDETLGCGGYIQQAVAAGADVHVVLMTNGEYPELSVILFEETLKLHPAEFIKLGYMRQRETLHALALLGVPAQSVTFFGYPNQYLNQIWSPAHWLPDAPVTSIRTKSSISPYTNSMTPGAVYCGQSVLQDVETVLLREKPDVVITIHPNDVHVDHWPTYAFVRYALEELGLGGHDFARTCRLYTYLIHRNYWPDPRGYRPLRQLAPPPALMAVHETNWLSLPLTLAQTRAKHRAIAAYHTQEGAYDPLLQGFARANDLFGAIMSHSWPAGGDPVSIDDPAADSAATIVHPAGDIVRLTLARDGDRLHAIIETRAPIDAKYGYYLSLHVGGTTTSERMIAEYAWQAKRVTGYACKQGIYYQLDKSNIHAIADGNRLTFDLPWPITDDVPHFLLIRAYTTHRNKPVDATALATVRINQ